MAWGGTREDAVTGGPSRTQEVVTELLWSTKHVPQATGLLETHQAVREVTAILVITRRRGLLSPPRDTCMGGQNGRHGRPVQAAATAFLTLTQPEHGNSLVAPETVLDKALKS